MARRPAAHDEPGRINREVCSRLAADDGIALQRVLRSGDALDAALPHPAEVEVATSGRTTSGRPPRRLAVIQPWEFGAIPAEWVDPIRRNVDEVWVPSEYVRRMYVAGGIEPDRVAVVPNGVDTQLFTPDGERYPLDAPEGTRFLFVGGLIERKAPELLVAAYLRCVPGPRRRLPRDQELRARARSTPTPTLGGWASTSGSARCHGSSTSTTT